MIQARIKSIEITEAADLNSASYIPDDFENFGCTLGLTIGPADSVGGELFYLTVCTPKWLAKACEKDGFVCGRHHLIVPEYDLERITKIVTNFVERCSGDSWTEVGTKLARIASWEYEDYRS